MRITVSSKFAWLPATTIGLCTLLAGCDSSPATSEATPASPLATTNVAQAPAPAPKLISSVGDRYPVPAPIYDPAVQQATYQANPSGSTTVSMRLPTGGRDVPGNPAEQTFVPGVEDLQLFEQPNLESYGKGPAAEPKGWTSSSEMLNWSATIRQNPLPHSP